MLANKLEGSAAAAVPVYIEDVFSTYLYTGNGSTQTITNGIDLAGKGGLVWGKNREANWQHYLADTTQGVGKFLSSNTTAATTLDSTSVTAFNSNGFSIGNAGAFINNNGVNYASWTFIKQPKFFDVVTYTGNGTTQNISHSLGSTPGCVIVKCTSNPLTNWAVWHRELSSGNYILLNSTAAQTTTAAKDLFGNGTNAVDPTSTVFTVGGSANVNRDAYTYVAYLFAHNAGGFGDSGTDNVISCGSYTGDASSYRDVSLGWEPQWILVKKTDTQINSNPSIIDPADSNWFMFDNMRGMSIGELISKQILAANKAIQETTDRGFEPYATGFRINQAQGGYNADGGNYIYIAIRRGPMKTPTDATTVFYPTLYQGTNQDNVKVTTTIAPDMVWIRQRNDTVLGGMVVGDRLRGQPYLLTGTTDAEVNDADSFDQQLVNTTEYGTAFSAMDGIYVGNDATAKLNANVTSNNHIALAFKRAPGFFDVVCYTGTGSATTVSHNLGVVPEMIITKKRTGGTARGWGVYHTGIPNTDYLLLHNNSASSTSSTYWNSSSHSSTTFSVGTANQTNESTFTYVAYLFASLTGISKVGSYTGNGSSQTINCGFTAGARFILIKRTDSTGDWYVYDSARGIVSGNDPQLKTNTTDAEATGYDAVDPDNSGFIVNNNATSFPINVNNATYIYLAIA